MSSSLQTSLLRKKHIPHGDLTTELKRCLNTFDITMLGVGQMIGSGIYVLSGTVIRETAGPAIVLSFLFAGLAAFLSALCYAEFGARFPKAGSAYAYTYVGCGEIWAFIVGWNVILELMLTVAAVSRSWAGYLDSMLSHSITNFTVTHIGSLGEEGSLLAYHPDFVAVLLVLISGVFVAVGSKAASNFNSFFTVSNLCVVAFVVSYGSTYIDFANWQGLSSDGSHSRFMPYGISGVLAGAASCFYAYMGFDGLATAGEEARNPSESIPHATYICMAIVTFSYVLMSGVLSLMQPYEQVDTEAAFSEVFSLLGASWAKYIVAVGAISGMTAAVVSCSFALPRCVYCMASDGLIFEWWGKVNSRTQTPANAVLSFTVLTAIIALLFDVKVLVDFLSIGTLLAYSVVSASIIVLRYEPQPISIFQPEILDEGGKLRVSLPFLKDKNGDDLNGITVGLTAFVISCFAFGVLLSTEMYENFFGIILICFSILGLIGSIAFIDIHQQNAREIPFKVSFVPYLPALSLLINILMMTHLSFMTWIRLGFWMTIGFAIYFFYGIRNSKLAPKNAEKSGAATFVTLSACTTAQSQLDRSTAN